MKAFIFDPLWDELITEELLNKLNAAGIEIIVTKEVAPLSDCKALFEGTQERVLCMNPDYVSWKLSSSDYKDIPNLKALLIASTGFDWVDLDAANDKGIPVCQVVNFSTQAVAEWAVTMMLNLARQTPRLIKDGFPLDFDKDFMKYKGVQLKGKTVGVIGLGNIGSAIAEACSGLGMNVLYWSRSPKNDAYTQVSLDELMTKADVIFPTLAKNEETTSLITVELMKNMKKSAMLVDITHGLFDHEIVLDMVAKGALFGYGFEAEPGEFSKYQGNVWAAPAYAWTTNESFNNLMEQWTDNMVKASKGEFPRNVNDETLSV